MQYLLTQEELDEKEKVFKEQYQNKINALQDRFIKVFKSFGIYNLSIIDRTNLDIFKYDTNFQRLVKDLKDAFHDESKTKEPPYQKENLIKLSIDYIQQKDIRIGDTILIKENELSVVLTERKGTEVPITAPHLPSPHS